MNGYANAWATSCPPYLAQLHLNIMDSKDGSLEQVLEMQVYLISSIRFWKIRHLFNYRMVRVKHLIQIGILAVLHRQLEMLLAGSCLETFLKATCLSIKLTIRMLSSRIHTRTLIYLLTTYANSLVLRTTIKTDS